MLRAAPAVFLAYVAVVAVLVVALGTWLGKVLWWLTLNLLLP